MVSLGMFPTKADADKALALAAADRSRGAWIDPARGKTTLAEYADAWLANHHALRPRTRRLYSDLLRLHILPTLGATELGRLTPAAVRGWHSALRAGERPGASTVAKAYRLLHAVLAGAIAEERIVRNPCTIRGASTERAGERPVASARRWPRTWTSSPTLTARTTTGATGPGSVSPGSVADVLPGSSVVAGNAIGRYPAKVIAWDFEVSDDDPVVTLQLLA
jgi:hypothetical protein